MSETGTKWRTQDNSGQTDYFAVNVNLNNIAAINLQGRGKIHFNRSHYVSVATMKSIQPKLVKIIVISHHM